MMTEPQSKLTIERPELWASALTLATNLTGYIYAPKLPGQDGTIWACGGGGYWNPDITPEQRERNNQIERIEEDLRVRRSNRSFDKMRGKTPSIKDDEKIKELETELEKLRGEKSLAPTVYVPEGAMEWLLHEVGHYVAATPTERLLPDYGYGTIKKKGWGKARELQAWGFEEIILSPFGNARLFAPPEHRGGTAFEKAGPIPDAATHHAGQQMKALGIDVEQWRALYGQWVEWERSRRGTE